MKKPDIYGENTHYERIRKAHSPNYGCNVKAADLRVLYELVEMKKLTERQRVALARLLMDRDYMMS